MCADEVGVQGLCPPGCTFPSLPLKPWPAVCSVTIFWRLGNRAAGRKGIGRSHGSTSCQSTCQKTVLQIIKKSCVGTGRPVWMNNRHDCDSDSSILFKQNISAVRKLTSRVYLLIQTRLWRWIKWKQPQIWHKFCMKSGEKSKSFYLSTLHYLHSPITTLLLPATHNTTTLKQMSAYLSAALAVPHVLSCPSHELFYLQGRPLNIKLRRMTPEVTVPG